MSALGDVVDRLAQDVRALPKRGQVALFLTAAAVLADSRRDWLQTQHRVSEDAVFEDALAKAADFASGRLDSVPPRVISAIETAVMSELSEDGASTTVQDCWICLDTALRGPTEGYDMASATWYMFEPLFRSVSTRIFGVADVGSEAEEMAEPAMLEDSALRQGVSAVELCIGQISTSLIDDLLLSQLRSTMSAIRP
ncbi:hypothetical protein [Myceligenerans halotolerans]